MTGERSGRLARMRIVFRTGQVGEGEYLRITPVVKWRMGVDEPAFQNGKPVIKKLKRELRGDGGEKSKK